MKRITLALVLSLAAALVLACGPSALPPVTPATEAPTSTPLPPATPTPSATTTPAIPPTPSPSKEWELLGTKVNGSTVTVSLRVFAGVGVEVTLDGMPPDLVPGPAPTMEYVFTNVGPGDHTLRVSDPVGHVETREVSVPSANGATGLPHWLAEMVRELESQPPATPPVSIIRYQYQGQVVYYRTAPCCDLYSDLYDADGNLIGHPDGGITGEGDGSVPNFTQERSDEYLVWQDAREPASAGTTWATAPIDGLDLSIAESFPLQYFLRVVSGLPSGCHSFGGYTLTRDGSHMSVKVFNLMPTDPDVVCTMVYGTRETSIPLGGDFDPNILYTVDVNGETMTFKGDQIIEGDQKPTPTPGPADPSPGELQEELDRNRQLWDSQGHGTYRMEFRWSCFCSPEYVAPVIVSVRDGDTIESVVYAENNSPANQVIFGGYETMNGLFDLLQEAIDRDAYRISVVYDSELGYPVRAAIDYEEYIADEERGFAITAVSSLE